MKFKIKWEVGSIFPLLNAKRLGTPASKKINFFLSCTQNNIFESRQKNWPHHNLRICTHCMQSLKFRWS